MKRKAKWTALLMCGILLLSGCSTATDDAPKDKTDVVNKATEAPAETPAPDADTTVPTEAPVDPVETPAPTETPTDVTETPAPTEAPTVSEVQSNIPHITILPEEKTMYAEDGTPVLVVKDYTLSISGEGFEALQNSFDTVHPGIIEEDHQFLYESALDHYEFNLTPGFFNEYSSYVNAALSRCDSSIVSFRTHYSDYTGGAHGMFAYGGETYDVETGQQLLLADIVADTEGFYPSAIDYISNALYEEYEDALFADYQSWVAESLSPDKESLWYMTATGIVICFSPYEVGPYAMGAPEITLPYSECAAYLHSKYLPSDGELVAKVGLNQDISSLIGTEQPIMIEALDNDWQIDISLVSGSDKVSFGTFNYFIDGYIIKRADGRSFIIISCDYMSADSITYLYEITDGNLVARNEMPNMHLSGTNISSERIEMTVAINALGSFGGCTDYKLTADGHLVHDDELYQITVGYPLSIIKPLPVTIDGTQTTLDAGTQIAITGTNLLDEIYFKVVGSNQTGTIHYTRDEQTGFIIYINGVSEYEYFEDLPYAG